MSNKAVIWFPYHIKDFRSEMNTYSFEERGVYLALIERLWECDGYLAGDDASLAAELGMKPREWARFRGRILRNFLIEAGRLSHARLLVELHKAKLNIEQKSRAGKASAASRKGNGCSTAVAEPLQRMTNGEPNGSATARQPYAGGGGGLGQYSPSLNQEEGLLGGETFARMQARDAGPFKVIGGGK